MCLNSMRYQILFPLWCVIPSGRALKKRFFDLISLIDRGFCETLHVYKRTAKPAHLQLVPQRTTFLKRKKMEKLCLPDDCADAGRERDRMTGVAPEAGADIQDRRHCVGRADICIHDGTRHNSIHGRRAERMPAMS